MFEIDEDDGNFRLTLKDASYIKVTMASTFAVIAVTLY
jgi:hypothetical protein